MFRCFNDNWRRPSVVLDGPSTGGCSPSTRRSPMPPRTRAHGRPTRTAVGMPHAAELWVAVASAVTGEELDPGLSSIMVQRGNRSYKQWVYNAGSGNRTDRNRISRSRIVLWGFNVDQEMGAPALMALGTQTSGRSSERKQLRGGAPIPAIPPRVVGSEATVFATDTGRSRTRPGRRWRCSRPRAPGQCRPSRPGS